MFGLYADYITFLIYIMFGPIMSGLKATAFLRVRACVRACVYFEGDRRNAWKIEACTCALTKTAIAIYEWVNRVNRFRCTGTGKLPASVFVSTSTRSLFTPEKRLGYRVAWWLVITKYGKKKHGKIWKNIEKHGVLPEPVRRNRGILRFKAAAEECAPLIMVRIPL